MTGKQMTGPLETAVRLLARREYAERELRQKLLRQNFDPDSISAAIATLKERGYLNDTKYMQRTIERLVAEKRCGVRGIIAKLRQMGLTVSNEEVREYCPGEMEWSIASQLVEKKFHSFDSDAFPRIARFLVNRGFSAETVSRFAEEGRKHQY
jgi:regulatory protein